MQRTDIVRICGREVLGQMPRLYGIEESTPTLIPGHEGCANLVYECTLDTQPCMLRISYRPDRSADLIEAELHFVNYLAEHGVRVSKPILSRNDGYLETLEVRGMPLHIVCFEKGAGMRVPDNGYRYREDAPIEEYFQNWGRILGRMHALTKDYAPTADLPQRPDWFEIHDATSMIDTPAPERLQLVRARIHSLLVEIHGLPKDRDCYGLLHGDFNDGNFTVDYSNGNITVFDFDDCCHFWFMYELASAWEGGTGRVMFQGLDERKAFMDHYMEQVMAGYARENSISAQWTAHLPLFVKLIQVEEFLHFVQYIHDPVEAARGRLNYLMKCIEEEIPYMGFFDPIFSPEHPFSL